MANNKLSASIEDEYQIARLLLRWGHARDSDDWETLAGCFHDDVTIHISWISDRPRITSPVHVLWLRCANRASTPNI